ETPLRTTGTLSLIIWLAQSVAPDGVCRSWQTSRVMGWPATPPRCSLMYLAAACPAGISDVLSMDALLPSVMKPTFTEAPVAALAGPSTALLPPAAALVEDPPPVVPVVDLLELLQAVKLSAPHANTPI